MLRVTIFNGFIREQTEPAVAEIYPGGIHAVLASLLADGDFSISTDSR